MVIEVEAKMRLRQRSALLSRLRELGAEPVEALCELNIFFDTAEARLRAADCGLRIRAEWPREGTYGEPKITMTYKGPRQHGALKNREELELAIDDPESASRVLEALGYPEQLRFGKERDRWRLQGCAIELDRLPEIGDFVEIEGPNESIVQDVRKRLGLDTAPLVQDTYASLVAERLRESVSERTRAGGGDR